MDKEDFQIRARFRRVLKEAKIEDGSRLLIAVSGGCDSVSLLHLCLAEARARSWHLMVGHIDHSLRPDSRADARWVEGRAGLLGLPYRQLRVSPARWARLRGESIEAAARRLRRGGLRRIRQAAGAQWILLGHTLEDQAETIMLNLLRGSAVRGLAGMATCRAPWLRPLLRIGRRELREFAVRHGLEWREDPSNQDPRFLRNRIRQRLFPLLEQEFQPGIPKVLARTAEAMQGVRLLLEAEAEVAWRRSCLEAGPIRILLDCTELARYHEAVVEEVLRQAFCRLRGSARDLNRAHVTSLVRSLLAGRPGLFLFPAGIEAVLSHQELRLLHPSKQTGER